MEEGGCGERKELRGRRRGREMGFGEGGGEEEERGKHHPYRQIAENPCNLILFLHIIHQNPQTVSTSEHQQSASLSKAYLNLFCFQFQIAMKYSLQRFGGHSVYFIPPT